MELFSFVVFLISIAALIYAGGMRLIFPENSLAMLDLKGRTPSGQAPLTDLKSELRGVGMVMLLASLILVLGLVIPKFQLLASVTATCIFTGIILGRMISSLADGKPSKVALKAGTAEMLLALLNATLLVKFLYN